MKLTMMDSDPTQTTPELILQYEHIKVKLCDGETVKDNQLSSDLTVLMLLSLRSSSFTPKPFYFPSDLTEKHISSCFYLYSV